jgi:D-alanyl-D-alanine carboxypeptidase/D-alanyl-D-alanine-endopeptidase (penicillin-binding protein 4)
MTGNPGTENIKRKYYPHVFPNRGRAILMSKGLAGYVDTKSGKRLVFAEYVNNVPISDTVTADTVGTDLGSIAGMIYKYC